MRAALLQRRANRAARQLSRLESLESERRDKTRETAAEIDRRSRRHRSQPFGMGWMRKYLPDYLKVTSNRLHRDLAEDLSGFHLQRGQWRVYEAPRGAAKSTWLSKGYPLYCACEGIEPYTLMLSDTGDQAKEFLDDVKREIETNRTLAQDYPDACGKPNIWRADRIRLANGSMIVAKGASGGRVRGRGNKSSRPSLVVVDDANERKDAFSPTLRKRKWDWFTRDVMSVGTARTNFLVAGTPIHREAISHRLRMTAGWQGRGYKAIVAWPTRMDLWGEWERIACNLGDANAKVSARAFYEANRAAMDAGAEVLWPEWESLYELMMLYAAIGSSAFASEKQDQPGSDGTSEWPAEWFDDPDIWFWEWPETIVRRIQGLDPSKGEGDHTGDYQAHGMMGLNDNGHLYLEVEMNRVNAPSMIERALDLARYFRSELWVVEDNGTMGFLEPEVDRQLVERNKDGKAQLLPFEAFTSTDPKASRIRHLGSYFRRKQIKIRNTPGGRMFADHCRDWPNGEFDDGPDMAGVLVRRMEMLVNEGR